MMKIKCKCCNGTGYAEPPRKKFTDRKPDETGVYIYDETKTVNVWTQRTGTLHGSDDYYTVYIETTDGEFVARWDNKVYSRVPSFVVGGTGYYK